MKADLAKLRALHAEIMTGIDPPEWSRACLQIIQALPELLAIAEAVERLRGFAQDVMETWPEAAPDGFDLQEYAVKHGLLREVEMRGPCGEDCGCTEYLSPEDWPSTCCRHTSLLTGKPETDAAIDRLLAIGEDGNG